MLHSAKGTTPKTVNASCTMHNNDARHQIGKCVYLGDSLPGQAWAIVVPTASLAAG